MELLLADARWHPLGWTAVAVDLDRAVADLGEHHSSGILGRDDDISLRAEIGDGLYGVHALIVACTVVGQGDGLADEAEQDQWEEEKAHACCGCPQGGKIGGMSGFFLSSAGDLSKCNSGIGKDGIFGDLELYFTASETAIETRMQIERRDRGY